MEWLTQGITAPKGFEATAIHAGIKRKNLDLSMVYSQRPCAYAGVFTRNVVQAAPVKWNKERLIADHLIHGIIINSGNANACTGEQGYKDAEIMASVFAKQARCQAENVLVASTGVIGNPLPMDVIESGIRTIFPHKGSSAEHGHLAAQGIMTTDTFAKEIAVVIDINGSKVTIGGMAKGSGMIHPNMGTMLSFITTDAHIDSETMQQILREVTEDTYNMISVDGDTSTNDMVLVLANGMSEVSITLGSEGYHQFLEAFRMLNEKLAKCIIKDGEGATKFIEVEVVGMPTVTEAKKMVRAVITSNLVKTAFYGEDANWGRILCALGYSGALFNPDMVDVTYESEAGTITLLEGGKPVQFDESYALEILKKDTIKVTVYCHQGEKKAVGWGCDLSYDYVKINGEYRT